MGSVPPRTACGNRPGAAPIYGHGPGPHAVRGGLVLSPRQGLLQPAGALEVASPARRVALDDQPLVVDVRVAVRLAVAQAVRAQGRPWRRGGRTGGR